MEQNSVKLCECGCGSPVKPGNKYILGHNMNNKLFRDVQRNAVLGQTPWNKGLTQETDSRIAQQALGMSGDNNPGRKYGAWNKGLTKDNSESMAKLAYTRTKETRKRMAEGATRRTLEGRNTPKDYYESGWIFLGRLEKNIYCRSSYEKKALELLNVCSLVEDVNGECLRIEYKDDEGFDHYYVPDFLVTLTTKQIVVLEVKPKDMLPKGRNPLKFAAARKFCQDRGWNFVIWTEKLLHNTNGLTTTDFGVTQDSDGSQPRNFLVDDIV